MTELPAPRLIEPAAVPRLRWGVVGIGSIARLFTRAVQAHTHQRIDAVAARDVARTEAFATEFAIDRTHAGVEALIGDHDIDVVYVATPHSSHREIALRAISAGKHVLVEKPFALSSAEGAEIAAASRAAGVCVMEAMWTRYLPQSDIISQLLADDVIGEIDVVLADFGFAAPFDPQGRMWDPELGGGALLDAGVYPLSFASSVIGKPSRIVANGALTSTGVDARAAIALTTPSGANALIATSMVSSLPVRATIVGSAGRIDVPSPFFGPTGVRLTYGSIGSDNILVWKDHSFETLHEGLSYQATAMASYIAEGRSESPLHTLDETVSILATIDEARRQIAAAGNANRRELAPGRRR